MSNISGLTALDPRVIATEKFIESKKIPPEQVPQFLMSMGADPRLVGLVSKYQKLQQAAQQQPKGPMPTTTVAQDVSAQASAAMPQRQQGVAALPAPVMDDAKFAGGGIVAFAGPDGSDVTDLTKLSDAELEALSKQAKDRNTAIAVWNEFSRRRGFDKSPADYAREGLSGVRQSLGMGRYAPGAPRAVTPAESVKPAAAPTGIASLAGTQFDPARGAQSALTAAMMGGNRQEAPAGVVMPTAPVRAASASPIDTLYDKAIKEAEGRKMYERAPDTTTPEEVAELKEKIKKLPEDKKRDAYLALAQAGFGMAQAASQRGATFLGAIGAGGTEGIKQMTALNKEYKQLDRDLNKEMRALQRYQTQVENQDRERNFNFEQSKSDRIESLRLAQAQNREQHNQFAETLGLKREALGLQREELGITRRSVEDKVDEIERLRRQYSNLITQGKNAEAAKVLDTIEKLSKASSSYLATQLREENRNPFGLPGAGGIGAEGGGGFTVLGSRPAE